MSGKDTFIILLYSVPIASNVNVKTLKSSPLTLCLSPLFTLSIFQFLISFPCFAPSSLSPQG